MHRDLTFKCTFSDICKFHWKEECMTKNTTTHEILIKLDWIGLGIIIKNQNENEIVIKPLSN